MGRAAISTVALAALLAVVLVAAPAGGGDTDPYGEDPYGEKPLVIGTVLQRDLDPHEGRQMRAGGITSVRFFLNWSEAEQLPYQYDWSVPDRTVREIVRDGLTPLPFVFGLPTWAAHADGYDCVGGECASYAPRSARTRDAFGRILGLAVRRYGPDGVFWDNNPELPYRPIRVWQLWNEPNLSSYYRPYVSPSSYAELVRAGAAGVRAEDPGAEVLVGGLSGDRTTSKRWSTQSFLRRFYAVPGVGASFDGLALHPYHPSRRGVLDQIVLARRITAKRDPGVDMWITEIGWASGGDEQWALVKTPNGQARLLRRVFRRFIHRADRWNLRGMYWFAWRDTAQGKSICGWCGAAGLRDPQGGPKPAYEALRSLPQG
jgi:hypothetical protein